MCQCSSELHFISTTCDDGFYPYGDMCQCSFELHFISTHTVITTKLIFGLCQCSFELHFISTKTENYATIDPDNFFPTPAALADQMLGYVDFKGVKTILEPSAGKGDLVEAIMRKAYKQSDWHIDCVEIDPGLQSILKHHFTEEYFREKYADLYQEYKELDYHSAKTYEDENLFKRYIELRDILDSFSHTGQIRLVSDDFLSYHPAYQYDLIVMNPPFDRGAEHLVHAIELTKDHGGRIVCLLNAETIRNPYSKIRKLLKSMLEKYDATVDFVSDAFKEAERKTDVEIAIIYLNIPKIVRESTIFSKLQEAEKQKQSEHPDYAELVSSDPIEAIITMYNTEIAAGLQLIQEFEALKPHLNQSFGKDNDCMLTLALHTVGSGYPSVTPNTFVRNVRKKYWEALFQNKKFTGLLTSNLQNKYHNMVGDMVNYEFNEFNISRIRAEMNAEMVRGVEDTIMDLFEKLTTTHCYHASVLNENIHYYNGWKTNKAYMVNKKCIVPTYGMYSQWSGKLDSYKAYSFLSDIEKALNYLDGGLTREVNLEWQLRSAIDNGITRNIQLKYFKVSFYKKGTTHIVFTNQELVDRLNLYASQRKGWLPPAYGKVKYEEMTQEEKDVIDSFQGKSAYEKIMETGAWKMQIGNLPEIQHIGA